MIYRSMSDYGLDFVSVALTVYLVTDDVRATVLISGVHALAHYIGHSMSAQNERLTTQYA